ncbi:hypothetical protein Ppa06_55970 [Planomonospora parontospora subsp. parontospora]|uniref:DUF998 domain-containing protein n=2 Tax=Planomonospora parontospora TaxID=58119 RepID=A0AA37BJP6_9ACTN|nr:DUF998 domain-containing protein [Planomonospora parontospora]GGK81110.1 hypothetical protein GCM10010126_45570 [Planomonospora parontospora]GII11799.1 hypothetical protein Ppa06_55970 [Planomonospora parontospora subsp. parontospora]
MLRLKMLYPLIACAGILIAAVAAVVGQIDPDPYLDPLNLTISEYAVLDRGGATEFAMMSLGVASFALVAGLRAVRAPVGTAAERLMLVWSAALVLIAVAPTVVPGAVLDLGAQVHRYVSVGAFAAMPVAGMLMVTSLSEDERWRAAARPVEWLSLAGGFGLLAITYVALPGDRVLIGLVERVLLGAEVALVAVLAVRLLQLTWIRSTSTHASRAVLG